MKSLPWIAVEAYRVYNPAFADGGYGSNFGCFLINGPSNQELGIIVSVEDGWEHVSVSLKNRCPNWAEMNFVKDLFFQPEETVVQYHPPKSDYVNTCEFCLHLWRHQDQEIIRPPSRLVGGV